MPKRSRKRQDLNELAKAIADNATGQALPETPEKPQDDRKNPAAVALGRLGGKKGGPARARKLTAKERSESAKKAATARWHK
jgi:hypothetical protein